MNTFTQWELSGDFTSLQEQMNQLFNDFFPEITNRRRSEVVHGLSIRQTVALDSRLDSIALIETQ